MTVGNFQAIDKLSQTDFELEDKAILYIMELTGLNEQEVLNMHVDKFNKLCKKVDDTFKFKMNGLSNGRPKNYIKVNGTMYRVNYEIKKPPFNAGRYVEVASYSEDLIGNLHKIMASMVTPLKFSWKKFKYEPVKVEGYMHEAISEDMRQLDFKHAYHSAVFFYALFTNSMKVLQPYFLKEMSKKMTTEKALTTLYNLQKTLDGFTMPKWYRNLKLSL